MAYSNPLTFRTQGGLFGFGSKAYNGGLSGMQNASFFDKNNNFIGFGDGKGNILTSDGLVGMNTLGEGSWMDNGSGDKFILGQDSGGFSLGNFGQIASAGMGLLQGIAALRQAQMAEKQLGLAKQQFGFQKGLANRNIANQAKMINNQYDNAAQVAAGMIGSRNADGTYGMTDQAIINQYANNANAKHVDGSAIG